MEGVLDGARRPGLDSSQETLGQPGVPQVPELGRQAMGQFRNAKGQGPFPEGHFFAPVGDALGIFPGIVSFGAFTQGQRGTDKGKHGSFPAEGYSGPFPR